MVDQQAFVFKLKNTAPQKEKALAVKALAGHEKNLAAAEDALAPKFKAFEKMADSTAIGKGEFDTSVESDYVQFRTVKDRHEMLRDKCRAQLPAVDAAAAADEIKQADAFVEKENRARAVPLLAQLETLTDAWLTTYEAIDAEQRAHGRFFADHYKLAWKRADIDPDHPKGAPETKMPDSSTFAIRFDRIQTKFGPFAHEAKLHRGPQRSWPDYLQKSFQEDFKHSKGGDE